MFHVSDLYLLAPQLSLALLAMAVMLVDLFVKRRVVTVAVALIGLIILLGFVISQIFLIDTLVTNHTLAANHAFFGMLIVDNYALLLFSVTGMMFMANTAELITIYISL